MSKQRGAYVPFTPGGSMVAHLASRTEERAWERLLIDASHMPYKDKAGFQKRGYTVELINGLEPFND